MRKIVQNNTKIFLARKQTRERRNITYSMFAEETGVGRSTISAYMNQGITNFNANTLISLCNYFGCKIGDLLEIVEVEDNPPTENAEIDED